MLEKEEFQWGRVTSGKALGNAPKPKNPAEFILVWTWEKQSKLQYKSLLNKASTTVLSVIARAELQLNFWLSECYQSSKRRCYFTVKFKCKVCKACTFFLIFWLRVHHLYKRTSEGTAEVKNHCRLKPLWLANPSASNLWHGAGRECSYQKYSIIKHSVWITCHLAAYLSGAVISGPSFLTFLLSNPLLFLLLCFCLLCRKK